MVLSGEDCGRGTRSSRGGVRRRRAAIELLGNVHSIGFAGGGEGSFGFFCRNF
jgi:hypothetical protein